MRNDFLASRTSIYDLRITMPSASKDDEASLRKKGWVGRPIDISWRDFISDQPIIGRNERYPSFLCAHQGDHNLCDNKIDSYYHVGELDVWIPPSHEVMVKTIRHELQHETIKVHGTGLGYARGCTGPLCRRYHREVTAEQARLRSERLRLTRERDSAEEGRILGRRRGKIDLSEYERLKLGAPAYAAVDALLVLWCMHEYAKLAPKSLNGRIKTWQEICSDRAKIAQFMTEKYGKDVFFQ